MTYYFPDAADDGQTPEPHPLYVRPQYSQAYRRLDGKKPGRPITSKRLRAAYWREWKQNKKAKT